jgi:hypothetical protein
MNHEDRMKEATAAFLAMILVGFTVWLVLNIPGLVQLAESGMEWVMGYGY